MLVIAHLLYSFVLSSAFLVIIAISEVFDYCYSWFHSYTNGSNCFLLFVFYFVGFFSHIKMVSNFFPLITSSELKSNFHWQISTSGKWIFHLLLSALLLHPRHQGQCLLILVRSCGLQVIRHITIEFGRLGFTSPIRTHFSQLAL